MLPQVVLVGVRIAENGRSLSVCGDLRMTGGEVEGVRVVGGWREGVVVECVMCEEVRVVKCGMQPWDRVVGVGPK